SVDADAPDSVHLTHWPSGELAGHHDTTLAAAIDLGQRSVDLARTLRAANGLKTRQPLAHAWLAVPDRGYALDQELLDLIASEINVKVVERIADGSEPGTRPVSAQRHT